MAIPNISVRHPRPDDIVDDPDEIFPGQELRIPQ
jgi:hypothetical protein